MKISEIIKCDGIVVCNSLNEAFDFLDKIEYYNIKTIDVIKNIPPFYGCIYFVFKKTHLYYSFKNDLYKDEIDKAISMSELTFDC